MKKIILLSILLIGNYFLFAENRVNWTSNPFEHKVFIENNGQFNASIEKKKKVFFSTQLGKINAFFTSEGIEYRYDEFSKEEKDGKEEREERESKTFFLSAVWVGSNPNTVIIPEIKQQEFYSYSENGKLIQADIFKKIIYKNIYPGIDIEYVFPKDQEGIKYSVIAQHGADISVVKLKYEGADKIFIDAKGSLLVKSELGNFNESAPVSYYENGTPLESQFQLKGNTVSFHFKSKTSSSQNIIIDPWISNPLFASVNKVLDIDFDDAGNVYAYGSLNPFQLVKFNSAGTKLWTFNVPQTTGSNYGCFAVDKTTGTSYVFQGSSPNPSSDKIFKISSGGVLLKSLFSTITLEFWRAKYDRCNHQLVIGSGGWYSKGAQISTVDTNLTAITTYNPLNVIGCCYDACLLAMDPGGSTCYLTMTNGTGSNNIPYNSLSQLPISSLANPIYKNVNSGYHFFECSIVYGNVQQCGFNGLAASNSWLYMWDGSTLKKLNKNTGAIVTKNIINTPTYYYYQNTYATDTVINTYWGGLDVDMCDNIYVGNKKSIDIYNSSLVLTSSLALPDTVFDVKLPQDFQHVYAGGNGFVTCINIPPPMLSLTHINSSNCSCTGTATANISACTTNGIQYSWNNGQTTQTATGLCPATYTVTATLNGPACSSIKMTFTDTVTIFGGGNGIASAGSSTICVGQTATLSASGGNNYSWNTGASTSFINVSPSVTTNYTVIVSNGSCNDTAFASVTVNPGTPVSVSGNATICIGSSATLSASGSSGYSWSTGSTTSSIVVTPASNSTYTVSPANSSACNIPATVSVTISPPPVAAASSATVCTGQNATLSASGGGNYLWSSGATTSSINISATSSSAYSVIVSIGTCTASATTNLTVNPGPTVVLVDDQVVCSGQSLTLDAGNPGASFLWSTGESSQAISVSGAGTYWVIVGMNNCLASDTVRTTIAPAVHLFDSSLCTVAPIVLDPGNGANSYLWSNGSISQTISVDVAGTYWVTAQFGNCVSGDTAEITGEQGAGALYMPNAFTPNGDHLNELFAAKGEGITSFDMKIFDRWGNLLFASDNLSDGWNGKIQGGNYILKGDGKETSQEDVYIWKINYTTQCFPKKVNHQIGNVTLVK